MWGGVYALPPAPRVAPRPRASPPVRDGAPLEPLALPAQNEFTSLALAGAHGRAAVAQQLLAAGANTEARTYVRGMRW